MSQLDLWKKSWDPFKELAPRSMERLFEDFYSPRWRKEMEKAQLSPSVDVSETKTAYSLKFDLPGVPKDQIKVDLHENSLTVSGERREEKSQPEKEGKSHVSEIYYGSFSRSFSFPEAIDIEKSSAKFDNGVLLLNLSKKETSNRRQIPVN